MRKTAFYKILIVFICCFAFAKAGLVLAATGSIDSVNKYAWSDNLGWVSFNTGGEGSPVVSDSEITGYAWSSNYGWINLSPATEGIKNDGNGNLSGRAWGENTGWIDFSGVSINSDGKFVGNATGDVAGTITFDCQACNVSTNWRPAGSGGGETGVGGGGGVYIPSNTSIYGVAINDGSYATNSLNVVLSLNAGENISSMEISNYQDFSDSRIQNFAYKTDWDLLAGDGTKNVYVRFIDGNGVRSDAVSDSIILDSKGPDLEITSVKNSYTQSENIILSGTTEAFARITVLIDSDYYSEVSADSSGKWSINLGAKQTGRHSLRFAAKDELGNAGPSVLFDFTVAPVIEEGNQENTSVIDQIKNQISSILDQITGQKPVETPPEEVVVVPVKTPLAFSGMNLIPGKKLDEFVLSNLPENIKVIAQKFPEIDRTFNEVGILKITDVVRLSGTSLKLPTITQSSLSRVEIRPGEFTPIKGVPIAMMSSTAKNNIPSEIIFAKAGDGLVDFNSMMSLNDSGQVQQSIQTLAGQPMQFIIKVNAPAKSVKGYLLFKSKMPEDISYSVPVLGLAASSLFASPELAGQAQQETDKDLVISRFEYKNSGDGVYIADVPMPVVSGEYESVAVIDYEDEKIGQREVSLVTVIDPEGYVYESNNGKQTRISGAVISLYWLNPDTNSYELWPAGEYQQENPQVTNETGNYSFLVPEGTYYIDITAPGYLDYQGKSFDVKEGSGVHANIQLKSKYWWLEFTDWKTALIVIITLMLIYNFYKDRIREAALLKKSK